MTEIKQENESLDKTIMSGAPVTEVSNNINLLAQQFEQVKFVRQLVYNSDDANSNNINVTYERDNETKITSIVFEDDGVGMSLNDVRNYLLCVYGSKHRGNKTKIGENGLGFLSVFFEDVDKVEVETTSENETYLVAIDPPKKGLFCEVLQKDEPNVADGTVVTLKINESQDAYQQREGLILSELELCVEQVKSTITYQGKEVQ